MTNRDRDTLISDYNHSDSKSDWFMLSTTDINELSKKRMWILIPAATVGVVVMLAYFAVVAAWRDSLVASARQSFGESTADALPIVLILPSIGFFLTAFIWGEHKIQRYALICPNCNADLSRSTKRVAATRCCNSCGKQIVEGPRTHGPEAFDRRSRIEQRKFLIYWFWAWPILGSLMIGYHWLSPIGFEDCPHMLFMPGLIGTTASGWAFARTLDKRYLPQLAGSAVVLCMGFSVFW